MIRSGGGRRSAQGDLWDRVRLGRGGRCLTLSLGRIEHAGSETALLANVIIS